MRTPVRHENQQTGEVYYRVRYRKDGRQRAYSFYGDTEAAARSDADEFCRLLDSVGSTRAVEWWNAHLDRQPGDHGPTLDEWWARYIESVTGITDGTRDAYRAIYNREWRKRLGGRPLTSVTREDIRHAVNQLAREGKSDKTIQNVYGVLTSCLKVALEDGHIPALPTRGIRLPRNTDHESEEMRFLTHAEWWRIYDKLGHYRPLFTFVVGTAARYGEVEALTVGDVDLELRLVQVSKAAKWNAKSAVRTVGPTKTRRSRRTITLPPEVVDEIRPLVEKRKPSERLFLAPRGGNIRHKPVWEAWIKAREKAKLHDPQPRIHDLRHTHVAWLIAAGVPLPVIQARLGHESIKTTIDRYGHLLPELQVAAAQAASLAMRRPVELAQ